MSEAQSTEDDVKWEPNYRPSSQLRFVERFIEVVPLRMGGALGHNQHILQQRWYQLGFDWQGAVIAERYEWRDVPLEEEATEGAIRW